MHRYFSYRSRTFQQTQAIETGISDFHKMVVTVMLPIIKSKNQNYKHFDQQSFNFG